MVTAYYFKEWDHFMMDFHTHRAIEIMYVMSGKCIVEVESDRLEIRSHQFVLIDSTIPHRLIVNNQQPCRMLNVEFILTNTGKNFPPLYELIADSDEWKQAFTEAKSYYLLKDTSGILPILRNLVFELDMSLHKKINNDLMIQLLLTQILLLIARNIIEMKSKAIEQKDIYVKQIIKFLHENYDFDLKMEHLSARMHLHPNYLHRIFKESMNCTIISYLTKIRIEKAKLLISQTDIPITEIAGYVGMNSSQYFSKLFKKHTGMTPTAYRKSCHHTLQVIEPYENI